MAYKDVLEVTEVDDLLAHFTCFGLVLPVYVKCTQLAIGSLIIRNLIIGLVDDF